MARLHAARCDLGVVWRDDDLLPYFRRFEQRFGDGDDRFRGRDVEFPITDLDWINPLPEAFLDAAEGLGTPRNAGYNAGTQFGCGYFQRYVHNGKRVSAAKAFLKPALRRRSASLRTRVQVSRVIVEQGRTNGARYRDSGGSEHTMTARREVFPSAGAINSPKLLQLSGIGPADLLRSLGVPIDAELPGVGENLRDHYSVRMTAQARYVRTINEDAWWSRFPIECAKWMIGRPSILALCRTIG